MDIEIFRMLYPSFTEEAYPDAMVQIRLDLAEAFFDPLRWPEGVREHVIGLYTAHFLTLSGGSSGAAGAQAASGIAASKSVDGVSISYDIGSVTYQGAGHWNATVYGRELYGLMRIFGAGGVQL